MAPLGEESDLIVLIFPPLDLFSHVEAHAQVVAYRVRHRERVEGLLVNLRGKLMSIGLSLVLDLHFMKLPSSSAFV